MYPVLFHIPWLNYAVPSYGVLTILSLLVAVWWTSRLARRYQGDPDIVLNLGFVILIFNVLGARAFYVIHYWDTQFAYQPWEVINCRSGGFEFYGGLIVAFIACCLYLRIKGLSQRLYADLIAPSLLLAMGIGRVGCLLAGCCWGALCPADLPWAVTFPCASPPHQWQWEQRLVTLPADLILVDSIGMGGPMPRQILALPPEQYKKLMQAPEKVAAELTQAQSGGNARKIKMAELRSAQIQRAVLPLLRHFEQFNTTPAELSKRADQPRFNSRPVHPAQLYSAVGPILLAWITVQYLHRRRRHGLVMVLGMLLYAIERFIEEMVRTDNPVDTFGLTVSQAISVAIVIIAVAMYFIIKRLPLQAPCCCPPARA